MANPLTRSRENEPSRVGDPLVVGLSIGFVLVFLGASLFDLNGVANGIGAGFEVTARVLGSYFQLLLLLTFLIAMGLLFTPAGGARLGGIQHPEMSRFRWIAIILCTLLAGGGVFFAAGEPVYHFLTTPPSFDTEAGTAEAVAPALAQSYMHWGFLAWAILGALTAIVFAHAHYTQGLPLRPRTLLVPVVGERLMQGALGSIVDAVCIIAVFAGTVGPIGFLATQVSFGIDELFGVGGGIATQVAILAALAALYVTSAVTGVHRGIQVLSRVNVLSVLVIGAVILVFGPTVFLVNSWFAGFGTYISSFMAMATQTSQTAPDWWMRWWTVFFFAWFMGYAPLMALFIARISRGRTIREMILAVAVIAPLATTVWFTLLGGSGIHAQLNGVFDLAAPLSNFRFDVATLTVAQALPGGVFMAFAILVLTTLFVATTGDSMSYSIAVVSTGHDNPNPALRAFWGLAMALMAAVLLFMGEGQISVLQQFIVMTAIPVSLVLLPSLWTAPRAAYALAREQGLLAPSAATAGHSH